MALAGQAGDPVVIGDYADDGGGAFGSLLRRFKELVSTIGTQRAGIKTVTEEIDALGEERSDPGREGGARTRFGPWARSRWMWGRCEQAYDGRDPGGARRRSILRGGC